MINSVKKYLLDLLKTTYGINQDVDIFLSQKFNDLLLAKNFNHKNWFVDKAILLDKNGKEDYLGTCFYMINSLQEFAQSDKDKFNRFQYKNSYQAKFDCATDNLVNQYFKSYLKQQNITISDKKSKVFITHDIDLLNSGLKQDAKHLFQQKDIAQVFSLIFNYFFGKRHTRNIDKIMQIDNEYDLKATFFWLVQNEYDHNNQIENGDYKIASKYIQNYISTIDKAPNFENGLHKSSNATSINKELGLNQLIHTSNRYHYLKFNPKEDYKKIANSKLILDTSLGFAEQIGFRNSFGLPFAPYDFDNNSTYNFLEVPLHIMDTTFFTYQKMNATKMEDVILHFLEQNKENALLTILWHNDSFSSVKFAERLKIFKRICAYLYENKIESVLPQDILNANKF